MNKKQYNRVLSYIEIGKREGATLLTGGKPLGSKGYYIEPTIFTDVTVSISILNSTISHLKYVIIILIYLELLG